MQRKILQLAILSCLSPFLAAAPAPRIFSLEGPAPEGLRRFVSPIKNLSLDGDKPQTWETMTRTGSFYDPRYGDFEITRDMLLSMVSNFEKGTYGQDIFVDVSHEPSKGAAAKILKLEVQGNRLRAFIEWTPYGVDAVMNRGFRYFSAEFADNFVDNEKRLQHGPTLIAAGLTIRPAIKHLDPVNPQRFQLAVPDGAPPTLVTPELHTQLLSEIQTMWKKLIEALTEQLKAFKLSDIVVEQLIKAADLAIGKVTAEADAKALCDAIANSGKQLAEQIAKATPGAPVQIQLSLPDNFKGGMDEAAVKALMEKAAKESADAAKQLADATAAKFKLLSDTINAAQGLSDEVKKQLAEDVKVVITAGMSDDNVKHLAAVQIAAANRSAATAHLAGLGFNPQGVVHIDVPNESSKKLQGIYHEQLKKTSSYVNGKILLADKVHPFVNMVLSCFDAINAERMFAETKMLAGGQTGMADTSLPIGFQREVIREALSDLRVLELVQAATDPSATVTTQIPYEQRDVSAVYNDGIVFEGAAIHRASITQAMDTAYILPMKLAFLITNEVMHFSRSSGINWDAMARNIESNARFMRELIVRRISNELQRSADCFGAVVVSAEAFDAQLTGANSIIKTVQFPIVRPHQQKDLQGNNVGSAENPITLVLNGTTLSAYDGTGTQSAGNYYLVINYNLGYVQLVNQAGTPVTPTDSGTNTITYSRATNVVKVDLDVPGGSTLEKQLNKVIQGIGARKALLSGSRYIEPDFLLMSPSLNDTCTNAEQFTAAGKREDAGVSTEGNLQAIKATPAWSTNAPGIDLGSERILIGKRGLLGYTIAKPYAIGMPFEAVDSNGKPIGKKQAYGEEYSAIKVPTPLRGYMTSVLAYSFTGR